MTDALRLEHYAYHAVADGIHAAIATTSGKAGGNAAIIDLGDTTLLVDCGLTRAAAAELARAAQRLSGRTPAWLVHTHYHSDHCWGNAALGADVTIVSTAGTRQLTCSASSFETHWYRDFAPAEMAHLKTQIQAERDPARRELIEGMRRFYAAALAESELVEVRPATVTFERRMQIHGSRRQVTLISDGCGHTQSDAVVYVPDAGVLVCGDLVTVDAHPFVGDGDVIEWHHTLGALETLRPTILIPGHGAVTSAGAFTRMRAYLNHLIEAAELAPLDEAEFVEWAASVDVPAESAGWSFASFHPANLIHEAASQAGRHQP